MNKNQGFTLIELMIVVVIIGIVSSYAIPAYESYMMRSKLVEVVTMSKHCQNTIAESIMMGESHETNQWGCEQNASGTPGKQVSKYIKSIQVDNHGVITMTLQGFRRSDMDDHVLNFAPLGPQGYVLTEENMFEDGPAVRFDCRTASQVNGIPLRFLPSICHGV